MYLVNRADLHWHNTYGLRVDVTQAASFELHSVHITVQLHFSPEKLPNLAPHIEKVQKKVHLIGGTNKTDGGA